LAYVAAQAERLKALDPAVRRDEPDAIHQMRVARDGCARPSRRSPWVVPKAMTLHARDELRWLGQVLGEARDNEVLSERFRAELASIPVEFFPGPGQGPDLGALRRAAGRRAGVDPPGAGFPPLPHPPRRAGPLGQ